MDYGKLAGKRILITGGSGFIGSHLSNRLLELEASVSVLDVIGFSELLLSEINRKKIEFIQTDIGHLDDVKKVIKMSEPEIVIHLSSIINRSLTYDIIPEIIDINVRGSINLLHALSPSNYKRLIFISSGELYGRCNRVPFKESMTTRPVSPYSASKAAAEQFVMTCSDMNNRSWVVLRPFIVYGEGQSANMFIPDLINAGIAKTNFRMTVGQQTRDYIYIMDLIKAIIHACILEQANNEVMNICSGIEIAIADLARLVSELMGGISLKIGELDYRKNEIWRMVGLNDKARKILEWEPKVTLREGLKRTIDWYKSHLDV